MGFWSGLLAAFSKTDGPTTAMREMRQEKIDRHKGRNRQSAKAKNSGKRLWAWSHIQVLANTRSEARAKFKENIGGPIPPHAEIIIAGPMKTYNTKIQISRAMETLAEQAAISP